MASATWMIKDSQTSKMVWSRVGAAPPEIMADDSVLQEVFAYSFPDAKVVWGPGRFSVMLVAEDGSTYRAGSLVSFLVVDKDGNNITGETNPKAIAFASDATPVQIDPSARIVGSDLQAEANRVLGSSGIPGMRVEHGIVVNKSTETPNTILAGPGPNAPIPDRMHAAMVPPALSAPEMPGLDQGGTMASHFGRVVSPHTGPGLLPPEPDSAAFTMLLKNVKAKLLLRSAQWPMRIAAIPQFVKIHLAANPEGTLVSVAPDAIDRLHGVFCKGDRTEKIAVLDTEMFQVDDDPKTMCYLRWFAAYETLEELCGMNDTPENIDWATCMGLSLEMFHDACELYLREKGWEQQGALVHGDIWLPIQLEMDKRCTFIHDKDAEYGQPTRRHGIPGVITRVFDKVCRYTNLKATPGVYPKFESILDSAKDLGGYSLILAGLFQEGLEEVEPTHPLCWLTTGISQENL